MKVFAILWIRKEIQSIGNSNLRILHNLRCASPRDEELGTPQHHVCSRTAVVAEAVISHIGFWGAQRVESSDGAEEGLRLG
jgi:hypothetical protein